MIFKAEALVRFPLPPRVFIKSGTTAYTFHRSLSKFLLVETQDEKLVARIVYTFWIITIAATVIIC